MQVEKKDKIHYTHIWLEVMIILVCPVCLKPLFEISLKSGLYGALFLLKVAGHS